eukprot:g22806.t1
MRRSLFRSVSSISSHEGLRGFWVGNFTNCMRVFPSKGILFTSNDVLHSWLQQCTGADTQASNAAVSVLSGSMAGALACLVTYPLDLAQTRMSGNILRSSSSLTIIEVLSLSLRKEGLRSWYKGISATLGGSLPFEGIKFGVYGLLQRYHQDRNTTEGLHPFQKLLDGACAGLVAQVVMFPNDTVRHRLQLQGMHGQPDLYRNARDCYRQLFRQGGVVVFYRGLTPNLLRAMPNTAIQFATFEACKDFFRHVTE